MKRLIPILVLGLLLCSCSPAPHPDVAQVRKVIQAYNEKAQKEMVAGIMDTTMSMYTDDAVSMPNYEPMSKGKQAIKEQYRKMMAGGLKFTKVDFTTTDVQVSGDYAFEVGTYAMTFEMPPMGQISDEGKYVTVYQMAKDGSWKVKVETWNTNKMPSMPKM